jgi:hypothetical protein
MKKQSILLKQQKLDRETRCIGNTQRTGEKTPTNYETDADDYVDEEEKAKGQPEVARLPKFSEFYPG